jgi:hypothetical protein
VMRTPRLADQESVRWQGSFNLEAAPAGRRDSTGLNWCTLS